MDKNYDIYVETINGLEAIEEQVIKDNKVKRCCYLSLEFVKNDFYLFEEYKKSK